MFCIHVATLIHIRNRKDGKYLTRNDEWSGRGLSTRVFATAKEAAENISGCFSALLSGRGSGLG
jgi:hypothetical protein